MDLTDRDIFYEKTTERMWNILISFDEYEEYMKEYIEKQLAIDPRDPINYDMKGAKTLHRLVNFSTFMMGPVCHYDGLVVQAKTAVATDFDNMVQSLNDIKAEGKRLALFALIYCPSLPRYTDFHEKTFAPYELDAPVMSDAKWKIRYAVIEDGVSIDIDQGDVPSTEDILKST